ncbi:hypothetical protein CEP52_010374 [Fusarium oligoseptatum]|uniref:Putative ER transporter 6TM N-terminal domain-containing protein n=1 Tax=Fusarium oligoseptatum TaxID=2604345 RepID=A0A428T8R2_9HYPO|nr:hypothetical protein CEP52_010374 [Fusarium oligoseptatum]
MEDKAPSSLFFKDSRRGRKLPKWLDHFNAIDLRTLFKCSLAVWIFTLFILIDDTLHVFGQGTFFGCIVLFVSPPSGVLFLQVVAGLMVGLGLCLGWEWGCIAMKNTTNVDQASGQPTYFQIAIYQGFMLDSRVSVTYFCMMGLFIYLMARVRVAMPKLALVSMFAINTANIYITMAPLIPTFQRTISKVLVLPAAVAVGVGAACNFFIFPRSTSQIMLDGMGDVLTSMQGFVESLRCHLETPEKYFDPKKLRELIEDMTASYQRLEIANKFLMLDVSYRKWSPEDISCIQNALQQMFIMFGELVQYTIARAEAATRYQALTEVAQSMQKSDPSNDQYPTAYHQISRTLDHRARTRRPDTDTLLTASFQALSKSVSPLLQEWQNACDAIRHALAGASTKESPSLHVVAQSLIEAHEAFEKSAARRILDHHAHLFDAEGNLLPNDEPDRAPPLFGVMTGLLYQEHILNLSRSTITLIEEVTKTEEKGTEETMRKPNGRQRHKLSSIFLALLDWFANPEGLHALRTLIVTLALAIPAVIPSSAGFYYREKGLWALVMGQLCLEPYASDFVIGLVYIGSGSTSGNPYGLAAVMAVAIALMMWWRLFAPPEHLPAGVMLAATMYIVVAYNWVDSHIPSYGNPGVGYTVFWRRLLLVLCGFAVAAVATAFPRPPSGSQQYRFLLSDQISAVNDRYVLLVSTWRSPPDDLVDVMEKEALASEKLLHSLIRPISLTKYEFSTSNIDSKTLG